jgi:hypothetical protein
MKNLLDFAAGIFLKKKNKLTQENHIESLEKKAS